MSDCPPLAHIGLARLKSSVRGDACGRRAGVLLRLRTSDAAVPFVLARLSLIACCLCSTWLHQNGLLTLIGRIDTPCCVGHAAPLAHKTAYAFHYAAGLHQRVLLCCHRLCQKLTQFAA